MFVHDETPFLVAVARGFVTERDFALAVVWRVTYAIGANGVLSLRQSVPIDPLPSVFKAPLWRGTSVTVSGTVHGPASAPHEREVLLRVGASMSRIIVIGDRRWSYSFGKLAPTTAQPFEGIELTFQRAFGGRCVIPPGLDDGGLPDPGGEEAYPLNPGGIGFYNSEEAALMQPLPNIEDPAHRIRAWDDRPVPVGVSPCPDLPVLRLPPPERMKQQSNDEEIFLRLQHPAPPALIFEALTPGTPIGTDGVGKRLLAFSLPRSPAHVATRPASELAPAIVRAVDINADAETVDVTFSAAATYDEAAIPRWIEVRPARGTV